MSANDTRIWTDVDFDRDGKQISCLRLPFSSDRSAYGTIPIPIVCIKHGNGPTALLVAGNHGDEYEGQVALSKLARQLDASELCGRTIILPALNYPAVDAGKRVSPLDQGNLNRMFPGDANGSPTEMIAHYVSKVLLPRADIVIDLHSGGTSLFYLPCCLIRTGRSETETAQFIELMHVFGAPIGSISDGSGGGGATTLSATAQMLGIPALTTELGGGASMSRKGEILGRDGVLRVLKHMGILPDAIVEPAVALGDEVRAGDLAGILHPIEGPSEPVRTVQFAQSGLVACQRAPALTDTGDCLFKLVADVT